MVKMPPQKCWILERRKVRNEFVYLLNYCLFIIYFEELQATKEALEYQRNINVN